MNTLMVEMPVTNLKPMELLSWVGSSWFYVCLTLAITITLGLCISNAKLLKSGEVYVVVVAGQVVEKGVVTEIRKVLPRTMHFVV